MLVGYIRSCIQSLEEEHMKRWYEVTISSFDPHDAEYRWREHVRVYSVADRCVAVAFRQINRPSRNTKVHYTEAK